MIVLMLLLVINLCHAINVFFINQQAYSTIDYMKRIEDFPVVIEGRQIREWIEESQFPAGRLFWENREFRKEDLERLIANTNIEDIREIVQVKFGWTLRRTNMRMYPSNTTIHKGNQRIDYNQYTLLEPFTPLAILHTSKDGEWLYVHAPFMRGWVRKRDVFISNRNTLLEILQKPFLVVAKGRVEVGGIVFGLGSKIPYERKRDNRYMLILPNLKTMWIEKGDGLEEGYLNFDQRRIKEILESLVGVPYDWGGKEGRWDCSSLVQSLYALFGLELPRNSAQQEKIGRVVANSFSSYEEFKILLSSLPPFRTLIFMKGHVMIYGGIEKGDIVIYHAVHRIRRDDGKDWHINSIAKNYLEREDLRNIYKRVVSVNLLD